MNTASLRGSASRAACSSPARVLDHLSLDVNTGDAGRRGAGIPTSPSPADSNSPEAAPSEPPPLLDPC